VNGLELAFVEKALKWDTRRVPVALGRLRDEQRSLGTMSITVVDRKVSYSTQDSRRKLQKGYVKVEVGGQLRVPETLSEILSHPIHLSDFVPPGKYSSSKRKVFDVSFLAKPVSAEVKTVRPKTRYEWRRGGTKPDFSGEDHIELDIDLGEVHLLVGNLPTPLLVEQEDYAINGFGVGILPPLSAAEQRKLMLEHGPHPHYAYILEKKDGRWYARNSHEMGVEQVFIRARPFASPPHWDLIIAAFERISDLVEYRIEMPAGLVEAARKHSRQYATPVYFTYTDDNLF
jgi:hypothetical protein